MSNFFLDSSALIKRYVVERGTNWLRALTAPEAENGLLVSQLTLVEITSAAMRRQRDGSLPPRTARAIRLLVERHVQREYQVVQLTAGVTRRALDLLELYPLRAYDAVQLASALESQSRLVAAGLPAVTFVSADQQLLRVAVQAGIAVDDPQAHP